MASLPCFLLMKNPMQDYAWGGYQELEQLFGIPNPENRPQAEIWMGAHPKASSTVELNTQSLSLHEFIAQDPDSILGHKTAEQFGTLPYLFKILNAAQALSIQVHPSKRQAEKGYAAEEAQHIPLDAPFRNYKDPNHKPELIYALTEFKAMNGFRQISEIIDNFEAVGAGAINHALSTLQSHPDERHLGLFFSAVLALQDTDKAKAVEQLMHHAQHHQADPLYALILKLAEIYPGDLGLFAPLLLNVVTLQPGEAMFLYARTPHAYIKGTGLEIMANSDNVLRAGLTPKHIDIPELIKNTRFSSTTRSELVMVPAEAPRHEVFPIPVDDFRFAIYQGEHSIRTNSAEIILAIDDEVKLIHESGQSLTLKAGQSAFIPACTGRYQLQAQRSAARAYN